MGAILWELFGTKNPIVDLTLFRDRSFLFTNVMMFATLFVLMSTTQLLPQFVQQVLPYNATQAGLTLMPGGLVVMALMPVVGFLVKKVQPKFLIMFGFIVTALSLHHLCNLEPGVSFTAIVLARMYQGAGLAFLFVPIQTMAYSNLPPGKSNKASALINLMRNLGGSVGISVATTLLARRSQVHQDRLVSHLTPTALAFQQQWHALGQRFANGGVGSVDATRRALASVSTEMQRQSTTLSYLDVMVVLMIGSIAAACMTIFLKRMDLSKASAH